MNSEHLYVQNEKKYCVTFKFSQGLVSKVKLWGFSWTSAKEVLSN